LPDDLALWAEIDLDAVKGNVERLKNLLSPGTALLAVVKAGGYGHGDVEAARAALEGGADWLGVARVHEGAALRDAGITCPILLLAEPPPGAIEQAVRLHLTPTIYSKDCAAAFSSAASRAGRQVSAHIKVDTGMHRYGVLPEDLQAVCDFAGRLEGLHVTGIWSHFAVAEDVLNPFTTKQFASFQVAVSSLGPVANGWTRHIANSAGTITMPKAHLDMVRCGIAIYGIHPSPALQTQIDLKPAMSLKSRVGLTKTIKKGEPISYGQRYVMPADGLVASIPCGYADGLRRALSNNCEVLVRGKRYPVCGTVTMDHFMINAAEDLLEAGDEVVIIGSQGEDRISAQEIANRIDTIPYEIVCGINSRVPRLYKRRS